MEDDEQECSRPVWVLGAEQNVDEKAGQVGWDQRVSDGCTQLEGTVSGAVSGKRGFLSGCGVCR